MSESNLYSAKDISRNDSYDLDSLSPLQLAKIKSATTYKNSKKSRRNSKKRSHSAIPIRRKQYRNLEMKLQIYQDKITSIQDDAEDTEKEIRREYELQLLHLETKYLHQQNANISLQNEIEKLRQQLSDRETSANTSIIIHSSNDITTQTYASNSSVSSSNSSVSSNSSSSSTTNTTTTSSSLNDMEINCNITYSNGEKQKNYSKRLRGNMYNKNGKKLYNNNQPMSFWENMLMLFRPPNLMCSACSNKTTAEHTAYRRK